MSDGTYRTTLADIYEDMAADISGLKRHWDKVTDSSNTVGSRSGGWNVRKEHQGNRLGPPFHEVAIYVERGHLMREVVRWSLDEDLPDDPTEIVRRLIQLETGRPDGGEQ